MKRRFLKHLFGGAQGALLAITIFSLTGLANAAPLGEPPNAPTGWKTHFEKYNPTNDAYQYPIYETGPQSWNSSEQFEQEFRRSMESLSGNLCFSGKEDDVGLTGLEGDLTAGAVHGGIVTYDLLALAGNATPDELESAKSMSYSGAGLALGVCVLGLIYAGARMTYRNLKYQDLHLLFAAADGHPVAAYHLHDLTKKDVAGVNATLEELGFTISPLKLTSR